MRLTATLTLIAAAVVLMLYPFWGLLHPQSYETVLLAEFGLAEGVSPGQVRRSAAMNWAPNGILASAFVCLSGFVRHPGRSLHARWSGGCFIVYPFLRAAIDAWSGFNLTSYTPEPEFTLFFSGEDLVYVVFGVVFLALTSTAKLSQT